jgi:predicted nucleic acid-binding protein
MILLDSDVMIDLLRQYPPAMQWFDTLDDDEEIALSGYVVMELIQGCRNKAEQARVQGELAAYGVVWLSPAGCDEALAVFVEYHLGHGAGLLDVLIGQTAVALAAPLYTFNQKHYRFIPGLQTVQPYERKEGTEMGEDQSRILQERNARYVVDTQGQPIAVLLTIEEYEHYLDLLDDEMDSQDGELAARLTQAATQPIGGERLAFRDYLRQRKAPHANQVQS